MPNEYTVTPQRPGLYQLRLGPPHAVRVSGQRWPFSQPSDLGGQLPPPPRLWLSDEHVPEHLRVVFGELIATAVEERSDTAWRACWGHLHNNHLRCKPEDIAEEHRELVRSAVKSYSQRFLACFDQLSWGVREEFPPNQTTTRRISP